MTEPISLNGPQLSEEELGALMAVLQASSRPDRLRSADDRPIAGGWTSYYRTVRTPLMSGRDAWRTYHRL